MHRWSEVAYAMWGKSGPPPVPVVVHLEDARSVSNHLWDHYLSNHTKQYLADQCHCSEAEMRDLLGFLASIHDIGKITPDFQAKVADLADIVASHGLKPYVKQGEVYKERAHHSTSGEYIVEQYLTYRGVPGAWGDVVGAHHGRGQSADILYGRPRKPDYSYYAKDILGGDGWSAVREEVLDHFWKASNMEDNTALRHTPDAIVLMVITGFIVFVDWVASNTDHFNGEDLDDPNRTANSLARIEIPEAWSPAGVPRFEDRFGFSPYISQIQIAEMMQSQTQPGLWIIESSMGTGKTESALLGAEILARKHGLHGLVFALPNRASTNSIFKRFTEWMDRLPEAELSMTAPVYLAHGKASLNEHYQKTLGAVPEIDRDNTDPDKNRTIASFFQNPKTYPLTPMLVSTVDHVLMCGLDAKHQMLRHIGFAGKVIVVDEVHAYGTWMNTFFDKALKAFGAYRIPVILLSATLPPKRRQELVAAYNGVVDESVSEASGYPLVTFAGVDGAIDVKSFDSPREGVPYLMTHCDNDETAIYEDARRITDQGGNVLIIRNTVARALSTYEALKQVHGEKTMLLHSRYLPADRERIELSLTTKFSTKNPERESGWIVIATQVAEQSLDVDFDHLITDLAPVDLVLQRLGRVFRNPAATNRAVQQANATIVDLDTDSFVEVLPYDKWTMKQAESVLSNLETITTPDDVPGLVRKAYEDDQFPDLKAELDKKNRSAMHAASENTLRFFDKDRLLDLCLNRSDENKVRDIKDQHEVVVLEEIDGEVCLPSWMPSALCGGRSVTGKMYRKLINGIGAATMNLRGSWMKQHELNLSPLPEWKDNLVLKGTMVLILKKSKDDPEMWERGKTMYSQEKGLA